MTKISEVKKGDTLIADNRFDCLSAGERIVKERDGGLFVVCSMGCHWLDGQVDDWKDGDGKLVGLVKK